MCIERNRIGSRHTVYLKLTAACHTKASNRKKTGITGITSTIGLKIAYASGNFIIVVYVWLKFSKISPV